MKSKFLIPMIAAVTFVAASPSALHPAPSAAQTAVSQVGDAAYAELLARYVASGADGVSRVDYSRWKASAGDHRKLDAYIAHLAALKPSALSRAEAFAYWANLYNALTLKVILDHYPVKSIKDVKSDGASLFDVKAYFGPWRTKRVTVEGRTLSLDEIEHEIMRPTFKDARVHYSVNCASIGCPNLKATPWRAETLEADLDAAARAFVNHPRGVTAGESGSLKVSSIYTWFKDDFGGDAGVIAHIQKYAGPDLAKKLSGSPEISGGDYNWSLNQRS